MPRRRRLLAVSALLAVGAALGVAPIVAAPAFADGVLQILTPSTGSGHTWDAAPNGFHVTGMTTDLPNDVEIYDGATLIGSCTPDGLGAFDCGVPYPYPGPHTINAVQGGVTHDSISVTVVYPPMNVPLTGFTQNAVSGGPASFSGQNMLYTAGYEYGYASVDFGGGDVRSCWGGSDAFGGWVCSMGIAGIPDGSYPAEVWTSGGPATGVHTTGTLVIAPYAVPVPVIDVPEPNSHLTTLGAVIIGGPYDFGALDLGAGGFITVTVDGPTGTTQPCTFEFYDYTETSWWCEIYPALGMSSVTAVVTEGAMSGRSSLPSDIYVVGRGNVEPVALNSPVDGSSFIAGSPIPFGGTGAVLSMPTLERRAYPAGTFAPWCYGNVIGPTGVWNCPGDTTLSVGEWEVRATATDVNGTVTTTAPIRVTATVPVVPPTSPTTPATPAPAPGHAPWTWSFTSDGDGIYFPGDRVSFTGEGVPPGSEILFELHSNVRALGTTTAAADGTFAFTTIIPEDVEAGAHHFVLTATPPGEAGSVLQEPVEIQLPLVEVEDEPEAEPQLAAAGAEGGGGSAGGSAARSEPAAPSILSNSVATLGRIVEDPFVLVLAGGLTIALLFLVAVPTELLNSTLSANTGRLGRVFVAVDDRLERLKSWFIRVTRSRALASGILVLVLSLIYGFTDPDFGFDLVSLRLVLALALGMFILTYVIGWVTGLLSRATWGVHSQVDLRPSIAIFAVVGVIAARILEFSPGFFVGVVIGLELLQASQRVASRVALLQFSLVVGVSVGAWLWYSALISGGPPTEFGGALLRDTLVALTAEGLTAAVIAILPLRFLEGRELFKESKALWLGAFFVIAFAWALLVLPTAIEGTEVGDVGVWVIVFAIFAVVTFALWAVFATLDRRREASEERNTAQHDRVHG